MKKFLVTGLIIGLTAIVLFAQPKINANTATVKKTPATSKIERCDLIPTEERNLLSAKCLLPNGKVTTVKAYLNSIKTPVKSTAKSNAKMSKTGGVSIDTKPTNNKKPTNPAMPNEEMIASSKVETGKQTAGSPNQSTTKKPKKTDFVYPKFPAALVIWVEETAPHGVMKTKENWEFFQGSDGIIIRRKGQADAIVADLSCSDSRYAFGYGGNGNEISLIMCRALESNLPKLKPTVTIRPRPIN